MLSRHSNVIMRKVIEYLSLLKLKASVCNIVDFEILFNIMIKIKIFNVPAFHIMADINFILTLILINGVIGKIFYKRLKRLNGKVLEYLKTFVNLAWMSKQSQRTRKLPIFVNKLDFWLFTGGEGLLSYEGLKRKIRNFGSNKAIFFFAAHYHWYFFCFIELLKQEAASMDNYNQLSLSPF